MAVRASPSMLVFFLVLGVAVVAGVVLIGIARRRERGGSRGGAGPLVAFLLLGGLLVLGYLVTATITVREERHVEQRRQMATQARQRAVQDAGERAVDSPRPAEVVPPAPPRRPPRGPEPIAPRPPQAPGAVDVSAEEIARLREALALPDGLRAWLKADALEAVGPPPEKPWIQDAAGSSYWSATIRGLRISGRRPGPDGAIVAYSGLEPSRDDALEAARRAASGQVGALVILEAHGKGLPASTSERAILEALGAAAVDIEDFLALAPRDTAVQELRGQTGNAYHRAAILVRADASSLEPLVTGFRERVAAAAEARTLRRQELVLAVASALGLALVVFLLYSFLNAGTKGHFAWPLRFVSLGTLILLYLGLMYFQGWFR